MGQAAGGHRAFRVYLREDVGERRRSHHIDGAGEPRTIVIYEAPHRIERTLADLRAACGGDREIAVCRELTKLYEQVVRGTLAEIAIGEPRGEYVVVLAGRPPETTRVDDARIVDALRAELAAGNSKKDAISAVSKQLGAARKRVYAVAVSLSDPS